MLGKWDEWYKKINKMGSFRYGNTPSYQLAEDFLSGLKVEDWGCGTGGFRRVHTAEYIGIDGSKNPFVDVVVDLRHYRSKVPGIMMRHVLEHNYDWEKVLENAVRSFKKRMCIVIFTPFQERTGEIGHNRSVGVNAPTIAFKKEDIEEHFGGYKWRLETIKSKTAYGVENIYYIQK